MPIQRIFSTGTQAQSDLGILNKNQMFKKQYFFSATLIFLCLVASISSPIFGRWGALRSFGMELIVLTLWSIWGVHALCIQLRRGKSLCKRRFQWAKFATVVFAPVIAIWAASMLGGVMGKALRLHEIRTAINFGLREDCMKILHDWPGSGDRIYNYDLEFAKLPTSIRMLAPVYVLNEHLNDASIPPYIGLCKNGWGGFAFGIRVFRNDEDANKLKYGSHERIAPGVYIWWQDT